MRSLAGVRTVTLVRRSDVVDGVIAVLIGVAIAGVTYKIGPEQPERTLPDALAYVSIGVASVGLAVRRRWPMAGLAVVAAGVAVYAMREYAGGPIYLTPLLAMYSVAAAYERRKALAAIATVSGGLIVLAALIDINAEGLVWALIQVGWSAAAFLLGQAQRARVEQQAALAERARWLEETRE